MGPYYKAILRLVAEEGNALLSPGYLHELQMDWYKTTILQTITQKFKTTDEMLFAIHNQHLGISDDEELPSVETSAETVKFFCEMYDLSIEEIQEFHEFCDNLKNLDIVIDHPVLRKIERKDWEIPDELMDLVGFDDGSVLRPNINEILTDPDTESFLYHRSIYSPQITQMVDRKDRFLYGKPSLQQLLPKHVLSIVFEH